MPGTLEKNNPGTSPWRRFWHIAGGSFFPILGIFISRGWLLAFLGGTLFIAVFWETARLLSPEFNRWMASRLKVILKQKERFRPTGTTYLLLASFVTFFFFDKYIAITALLFLAVGDPLAAAIGQKYGRHHLFGKSLEGSLGCLVSCLSIGLVLAATTSEISIVIAISGAFCATVIEFLPIKVDDNLTIPLASAGIMTLVSLV